MLSLGRAARARTLLEEDLSISREMGNFREIALILDLLGQSTFQQGELSQAEAFLTDSIRLLGMQHIDLGPVLGLVKPYRGFVCISRSNQAAPLVITAVQDASSSSSVYTPAPS